jgi:hypothetical protein
MTGPMGPQARDNAVIVYPVGELLDKISKDQAAGFARVQEAMVNKADKSDVARIEGKLTDHGHAIEKLKERQGKDDAARAVQEAIAQKRVDWRRWATPVILSTALTTLTVLQALKIVP